MVIAAVHFDPLVSDFVILSLIIIVAGFILRILQQPSIITYIIVGILVGPHGFGLITDETLISNLGSLGLVLLLFFIGMEIHLPDLIANWRVSVIGTTIQIVFSVFVCWLVGNYLNLNLNQVILIGFVISLSSTAVVIKILEEKKELQSKPGQYALGILLAQDIIIVPMLIILGYLGGQHPGKSELIRQIIGGLLIISIVIYILKRKEMVIPFRRYIRSDKENQVFVAFFLCFGISGLTSWLGLSAALGAFVAGIIVSSSKATQWVSVSLHSFKVLFVALFFVSIGILIDIQFLRENWYIISIFVALVFLLNNSINSIILRIFCKDWRISLYSGALLSQVGEFSFIIAATGYQLSIIGEFTYQIALNTIALSLLLSPMWISLVKRLTKVSNSLS